MWSTIKLNIHFSVVANYTKSKGDATVQYDV